jgi:hypothetical protein
MPARVCGAAAFRARAPRFLASCDLIAMHCAATLLGIDMYRQEPHGPEIVKSTCTVKAAQHALGVQWLSVNQWRQVYSDLSHYTFKFVNKICLMK